jgi:hypothetical protein
LGHRLERRNCRLGGRHVLGAAKLPSQFIEPLHDRTRSVIFGFDNSPISELARRTTAIAQRAG